jgi:hypothetical protein
MARATCGSSRTRLPRSPRMQQLLSRYSPSRLEATSLYWGSFSQRCASGSACQERLHLALLDREVEKISGIGAPINFLVGVDAKLGELDREEILVGSGEVADGDDLALEIGELVDSGTGTCQHAHAAAMGARRDLDVKPLLQWLQPAQRHPEPGIALAGGDRFQQLVGRAAVVDEFDVEIVLLEKAVLDRDRNRRKANRAGIPREFQFARRACNRRRIRRRPADWKLGEVDCGRCSAKRKRLRAEHAERRRQRCGCTGAQQRAPVQQGSGGLFVF